jgi:hypothetical protein
MKTSIRQNELTIPIGADFRTGDPVAFPWTAFERGGYFTGQSGQGKSSTICRFLTEVTRRGAPALIVDDAGETFQQMERFAAFRAGVLNEALLRAGLPEHVRRRVIRNHVLRRFTFGFIGHGRNNAVGIDLLKRRIVGGRKESVEEVVLACLKPFEARFSDMSIRTKFVWVVKPLLAALIAGERPITEALTMLLDPPYWSFLMREIERCKTLDDPEIRRYVLPRLREIRRILDLRRNKEGLEVEPFSQRFMEYVDSTKHALEVFQPGTIVGDFFESDTFDAENVVFGNGVFAVTSNVTSELARNLALSSVYTFFERLMAYRTPAMRTDLRRLYVVLDEIRWFYEGITRFFSVARNHKVSAFILNQQDDQWEQLGMPALSKIVPSLLRMRVQYRAASRSAADEMALRLDRYDPFGMLHREETTSYGRSSGRSVGESSSDSDGRSWGTTENVSNGHTYSATDFAQGSINWSDGRSRHWGESSTTQSGTSSTESENETETISESILSASASEQHFLRVQDMLALPEHCAIVSHEGVSRLVKMRRFYPYPTHRGDVNMLEWFQDASRRQQGRQRTKRPKYDRTIHFYSSPTSDDAPASRPPAREQMPQGKPKPDAAPRRRRPRPKQ